MAFVKRRRIDAKESPLVNIKVDNPLNISFYTKLKNKAFNSLNGLKLLSDPKWIERFLSGQIDSQHYCSDKSDNVVDFLSSRIIDNRGLRRAQLTPEFGTRHLLSNNLLREHKFDFNSFNKVFSSQWLNDKQVVFGTKCNKLVVLDVMNGKRHLIPNLKSSFKTLTPENSCGIHAIEINPSRTLLATGGQNPNDIAVYRLPTLDPVSVGECAHSDWIFDLKWLDDQFLVSGSRDTTIALWRFDDSGGSPESGQPLVPNYDHTKALMQKKCKNAEKIRALLYNSHLGELVVLSLNAQLHLFDSQTLNQKHSAKLPFCLENVCLSHQTDRELYAVGSKSHIALLDARTLDCVHKIGSKDQGSGVRSLSFSNELLTIGTGEGTVLFFDIRAKKYLENGSQNFSFLKACKGHVIQDYNPIDYLIQFEYWPAIYTHQYDASKTRLFAAGGPLPATLQGNYTSLWM